MLYRGQGTVHTFPHSPLTDGLLSAALAGAGHLGSRAPGRCTWGSTSIEQAVEYTRDGTAEGLLSVVPLEGAIVSWSPGCKDLLLQFENWLGSLRWNWENVAPAGLPQGTRTLVRDIGGDMGILDTYLSLGRHKKQLSALANAFVSTMDVREAKIAAGDDILRILDGHEGEVWITGPYRTEAAQVSSPSP